MAKPWAVQFYNSKRWKDTRKIVLRRDLYSCQECGQRAQEVHHIIELTPSNIHDVNISLNIDNLVSLCHDCHSKITKGYDGDTREGYIFDADGYLVPK